MESSQNRATTAAELADTLVKGRGSKGAAKQRLKEAGKWDEFVRCREGLIQDGVDQAALNRRIVWQAKGNSKAVRRLAPTARPVKNASWVFASRS